jgi:para-aminobenzoate synthetase component 1
MPRFRFAPEVERIEGDPPLFEALLRLGARRAPVFLDGAAGTPRGSSLLAFDPLPLELPRTLRGLRERAARIERGDAPLPPFFAGGFAGALAYELGAEDEPPLALPGDPWHWPRIVGGFYVDFLVRDEERGQTWLVLGDEPGDERASVRERRAAIRDALATSVPVPDFRPAGPLERRVSSAVHRARIEAARAAIAAGEIYQANLAHPFVRATLGDPLGAYARLRRLNPAPYAGFLRCEHGALLSASPELLLDFDPVARGARTRPIKGTIGRAATEHEDRARAEQLRKSAKDLAELTMIVDLERNDLGRIAVPGGVAVEGFARLETYATVHHLVADVLARVRPGRDAVDALVTLFPGGSITGAPKLRSMEIIAELEGEGRGMSFGALGALDLAGRARFNLSIRTILWRSRGARGAGEALFRVGGGITWASRADEEDEETLAKAAGLACALDVAG